MISKTILLASKSPRRKQLLAELRVPIQMIDIDVEESYPDDLFINNIPRYLAEKKASAYQKSLGSNEILLAADTIVVQNDRVIGKPENRENAKYILHLLSDNTHKVISGVHLKSEQESKSFSVETLVTMSKISDEEIEYYISNWEVMDKAGAYGIQDWIGWAKISKIAGSYSNVMGLPMCEVYHSLAAMNASK